jgi:serine beta-lactamase-like protein LACTB, mitochondrial
MKLRRRIVLGLAGAVLLAWAPAWALSLAPGKIRDIEQAVETVMAREKIPGLTVAVAIDDALAWTRGFGMADLENRVPATSKTVYRLGSISKPVTAVAVMQLVEKDRLELDSPIRKYVPAFPEKPWPVTIRQLLAHLGGIRHYSGPEELDSTRHYTDLLEPMKIFRDDPLLFEPGTKFAYTTYGYLLLGAAVEAGSRMKFMDYLRENIFRPADMDSMRADSVYDLIPNRTRGYRRTPSGTIQNCGLADTSNKIPGGGMVSTASDLVKFAAALDRGTLLGKELVRQMFTPQKMRDGKPAPYGLGWRILSLGDRKAVGHGGAQQGTSTFLLLVPGQGLAVAVMENLEGTDPSALAARIAVIAE